MDAVLADILDAVAAAAELVARGKPAWDEDRLLRLAGEAIIGRVADAAGRLPEDVMFAAGDVPWDDLRDIRILVDHIYHRIDYEILWRTLTEDLPHLQSCLMDVNVRIESSDPAEGR
ncbi:MAG: HepT-like ribonuclease domain-containing protein [Actinomycetota bacterium]